MRNNDEFKKIFNDYLKDNPARSSMVVDYGQSFEIMYERTGKSFGEEMRVSGQPRIENGKVVGGVVSGCVCYVGYGTSWHISTDGLELSADDWQKFADKSVEISLRREKEEKEKKIQLHKEKVLREYKGKHPVNMILRGYLSENDGKAPVNTPNYEKEYKISAHTGGDWNEHIVADGKPILWDGKLVGGLVKVQMSWFSNHVGGASKEHPYEEVSVERWKAFVHKSIKLAQEKARIYGNANANSGR